MYKTELHAILCRALERAKWTRSTKDEDNFRQVICSHLYQDISPNNTEVPSTRSGAGDIRIFGRKIELKYINGEKRDNFEVVLQDIDLLLESKVEFCVVAIRFESDHRDANLVRAVELPLLAATGAIYPIADHAPLNYYGPGILLPACYVHAILRISVTKSGLTRKTNSYLSFESNHNIERSSFLRIAGNLIHVDVIGSREDGLLIYLYKRADEIQIRISAGTVPVDITVPYTPNALKIATLSRVSAVTKPLLAGRKEVELELDVPLLDI